MNFCVRAAAFGAAIPLLFTSPAPASGEGAGPLDQLAWMAGCWEMRSGDRLTEEQWMTPLGTVMPGMGRTSVRGRVVAFEQMLIRLEGDTPILVATPSGQSTTSFRAEQRGEGWIHFANAEHDFPQRIGYRVAAGGDSLLAHIEGSRDGEVRRVDFPFRRAPCPDGEVR
jgi:hypothetical protein